jgi:hypothetical protein
MFQITLVDHVRLSFASVLAAYEGHADAAAKLNDVAKGLPGTPAGAKAKAKLDELSKMPEVKAELAKVEGAAKASEELSVAQQLKTDGKDEQAYVKFKAITPAYPDTDAAQTAQAAVAEYEKDPAFAKRASDIVVDRAPGLLVDELAEEPGLEGLLLGGPGQRQHPLA